MDGGADVFIKAAQHGIAAIHQAGLDAETGKHMRKLDGDVTAACDDKMPGQCLEVENLVRRDRMLDARQLVR